MQREPPRQRPLMHPGTMSEISTISTEVLSAYNTRNASAFLPRAAL